MTSAKQFGESIPVSRDWYRVLGVSSQADQSSIRAAWKTACLKYHPDKNPDAEGFHLINMAYSVLRDASLRRVYDAALMLSRREQSLAQASDHGSSGSSRARRSCCRFWADFSRSTRSWADGRSRSIRVRSCRFRKSSAGVRPVVGSGDTFHQGHAELVPTARAELQMQEYNRSNEKGRERPSPHPRAEIKLVSSLLDAVQDLLEEAEGLANNRTIRIRNGHGSDHTLKHVLVVVPKAHMDAGSGLVEAFRLIKDAGSRWSSMLPDPMQLLSSRKTTSPGVLFRCSTQVSVKSRPVGSSTHSRDETPSMRAPSLVQVTLSDFLGFLCPSEPHTRFSSASPLSPTHTALKCSFAAIASYSESTTVSQVLSAATLSVVVDELIEVKLSRRHTSPKRNSAHEAFRLFRCTTPTLPRRNDRLDMKQLSREAEGRGICHTDSDKFRQSLSGLHGVLHLGAAPEENSQGSALHRAGQLRIIDLPDLAAGVFVNGRTENATSSLLIDDTADGGNLLGSGPARAEATLEAQQQRVEAGGGISSHGPQCSEACKTRQRSVSIIFVDFRKAFDSVSRPAIAWLLSQNGVSAALVSARRFVNIDTINAAFGSISSQKSTLTPSFVDVRTNALTVQLATENVVGLGKPITLPSASRIRSRRMMCLVPCSDTSDTYECSLSEPPTTSSDHVAELVPDPLPSLSSSGPVLAVLAHVAVLTVRAVLALLGLLLLLLDGFGSLLEVVAVVAVVLLGLAVGAVRLPLSDEHPPGAAFGHVAAVAMWMVDEGLRTVVAVFPFSSPSPPPRLALLVLGRMVALSVSVGAVGLLHTSVDVPGATVTHLRLVAVLRLRVNVPLPLLEILPPLHVRGRPPPSSSESAYTVDAFSHLSIFSPSFSFMNRFKMFGSPPLFSNSLNSSSVIRMVFSTSLPLFVRTQVLAQHLAEVGFALLQLLVVFIRYQNFLLDNPTALCSDPGRDGAHLWGAPLLQLFAVFEVQPATQDGVGVDFAALDFVVFVAADVHDLLDHPAALGAHHRLDGFLLFLVEALQVLQEAIRVSSTVSNSQKVGEVTVHALQ
uniref:DnaJ homolog subfamily B member 9 n=1 Tax=Macrostomum lignano TaxID=282301 RepID=A0A1I8I7E4_9PLAT